MASTALKFVREFHGMKQNILANKLEISCSYLSEIESGKKKPSLDLLDKYAENFKVPASSLLLFSESLKDEAKDKSVQFKAANKILKIMEWISDRDC